VKNKYPIAGILVALFISSFLWFTQRHSKAISTTSNDPDAFGGSARSNSTAGKDRSPVSIETARNGSSKQPSVTICDLASVLPEIREPVADWREYNPERITIHIDHLALVFTRLDTKHVAGRSVWRGMHLTEEGGSLVSCGTKESWFGVIVIPGLPSYEVTVKDNVASVRAVDPSKTPMCGVIENSTMPAKTAAMLSAGVAPAAPSTVDVLFFYDTTALALAGDEATIANRMISYVETSNVTLLNSNITQFQWRYLGIHETGYTTVLDMSKDLYAFSNATAGILGATVKQQSDAAYADQMVLITGGNTSYAGLAWVPGNFAAISWINATANTLTHEMGHNFGCQHDRATQNALTLNKNDGLYCYGYTFDISEAGTTTRYGTVMSYSQPIPYFSSPLITYGGVTIGVAQGDPLAADNARMMREHASDLINFRTAPSLPQIINQPVGMTVTEGMTFTISVTATGANITYQWKHDGNVVAGETNSAISHVAALTDAGNYTVIVTNPAGSVASNAATLTVNAAVIAPKITSQPADVVVTVGTGFTFVVSATGTNLAYQWKKNGIASAGEIGATLTRTTSVLTDAGNYSVFVSNSAGNVESTPAKLTVNPVIIAPQIITHPTDITVMVASGFSFSVVATGSNLTYQWKKNGTAITGETNATLTRSTSVVADAGDYSVVVSNSANTVESISAKLSLNVVVTPPTSAPVSPAAAGGGGGAVNPYLLILGCILASIRFVRRFC